MSWQEFLGLVEELPPHARFWRAAWEPFQAEKHRKKLIEQQRTEQRKRLGLGAPPRFPHRSRV